jgi:alpha-L-rhamnosidase
VTYREVRANPRRLHYDSVDIAPYLREGANVLAAVARFYGRPTPWWIPAPTTYTLGAGCFVCEALIADERITTDSTWRALDATAWERTSQGPGISTAPLESLDARDLPAGWAEADFDDSRWPDASELTPEARAEEAR